MHRRGATARALMLVVLMTCLPLGLFVPVPAAQASCIGPTMGVAPAGATPSASVGWADPTASAAPVATLEPGGSYTVVGEGFIKECGDTVSCTAGCGGGCTYAQTVPWSDVELVLVQGSVSTSLGTASASDDPALPAPIRWDVVLPPVLRGSGPATLEARAKPDATTTATLISLPVAVAAS